MSAQAHALPKCENQEQTQSILDEPWLVRMLPAAEAEERKKPSLPWRMGDVARLKDDSPEGMMKYIATHTTGWWQEMAERALRDTEKAQRMAEEAGWQPGQYWSLEVDAEAKERMLALEEARRQREEGERAREQAEKEAFARRQMELLKKAGKAPRCEYLYTDGRGCRAPQVKGERWCHGHAKMMSYRPEKLELEPMEDENAVMVNLHRVTRSLLSGRITEKMGGLMLWSVAIAAPCVRRVKKSSEPQRTRRTQRKTSPLINTDDTDKKRKSLPQMNADRRRSKTYHRDTEARRRGRGDRVIARERNGKTKTVETRRNGVSGGGNGHSGVTSNKSFRFGVGIGEGAHGGERTAAEGGCAPTIAESGATEGTEGIGRSGHRIIGPSTARPESTEKCLFPGDQVAGVGENCRRSAGLE